MPHEAAVDFTDRLRQEIVTEQWVKEVAATRDTDLRAHRVALTYHYFARELDQRINGTASVWSCLDDLRSPVTANANWFNFGTWATVTINRDLGLRRTPAGTDRFLFSPLRRSLTPLVLHLRAADGQRVTRALSWGQRLVFLSTTLTFVRRWGSGGADGTFHSEDADQAFRDILDLARWGDQRFLDVNRHLKVIWSAFDSYHLASQAAAQLHDPQHPPDRATALRLASLCARRILRANLMITAVEQDVVNDAVGETIDHLPRVLASSLTGRMATIGERRLGVPRELTGLDLPFQLAPTVDVLTAAWARFMTEQILVLALPSETLRLGKDLPPRDPSLPLFPPDLADLRALPGGPTAGDAVEAETRENAELGQLVAAFDRSRGGGHGSAAHDWRRYDDRMNWAVNMLRSRQQNLSLYWSPYTQEDQKRIVGGELPHRGGDPSDYEVEAPLEGLPSIRADRY